MNIRELDKRLGAATDRIVAKALAARATKPGAARSRAHVGHPGSMDQAGRGLEKAIAAAGRHMEQAAKDLTIEPGH